ncbi:hypothetical protein [Pantoea sp. 1.19]|uniref:hypothetical protein n=1 Tax=Pantoea sp. 1.19 TaxID=1925589 RepID=UPI000948DD4A|nr:hypothetical protein [Pantoea sp. 1.19]
MTSSWLAATGLWLFVAAQAVAQQDIASIRDPEPAAPMVSGSAPLLPAGQFLTAIPASLTDTVRQRTVPVGQPPRSADAQSRSNLM